MKSAFDRAGEVGGLDRGAVGVLEALAQDQRVGLAAVADLGQALGEARDHLAARRRRWRGRRSAAGCRCRTSPSSLRPCRRAPGRGSRGRRRSCRVSVPPSLPPEPLPQDGEAESRPPPVRQQQALRASFLTSRPPSYRAGQRPPAGINSTIISSAASTVPGRSFALSAANSCPAAGPRRRRSRARRLPATRKVARGLHCGRDQAAEQVADAGHRRRRSTRARSSPAPASPARSAPARR